MIRRDRLAETFRLLVETDSISKEEIDIFNRLKHKLESLGAEVVTDNAGKKIGGTVGNLIARFRGNRNVPPLMLNAHMDTVEPGRGVKAVLKDGIFTSDGTTVLGADDKSAIAILLESLQTVIENDLPCGPVELVLTVCEELGLQGAKNMDYSLITAPYGYALDAMDTQGIVTRAPGANRFEIRVLGKEAHAGAAPEQGINAIAIAGKAISRLQLGRIDDETTCNIGTIEGGTATNIIPNMVVLHGEARSHDPEKLAAVTENIFGTFREAVNDAKTDPADKLPALEIHVENDFARTLIPEDHPVVTLARQAARNLGQILEPQMTGGGADANIFFEKGLVIGVLGTGMRDMHTVRESVALEDMATMAGLVIEILRLHAEQQA